MLKSVQALMVEVREVNSIRNTLHFTYQFVKSNFMDCNQCVKLLTSHGVEILSYYMENYLLIRKKEYKRKPEKHLIAETLIISI